MLFRSLGRSRLELKVVSGGVIPVKVRRSEPVSWSKVRQETSDPCGTVKTVKTVSSSDSDLECPEHKLTITLAGQQGLGCSICKVTTNSNFFVIFLSDSILIEWMILWFYPNSVIMVSVMFACFVIDVASFNCHLLFQPHKILSQEENPNKLTTRRPSSSHVTCN